MEVTNIFMNSYQQPENKLTYNLLCLIEHMEQPKAFCEFLLGNKKSLSNNPLTGLKTVFSGGESNPDGMIRLQSQDKTEHRVYMENKTLRSPLVDTQLRNHLSKFCEDDDSFLLVTTPRISDIKIIDKINSDKIIFKTWSQIAAKLEDINREEPSFIISQFIEYGKKCEEFEDMEHVTKKELESYIETIKSNFEGKMRYIFDGIATEVNFNNYGINVEKHEIKKRWGRHGTDFFFKPKNDYYQWFFYGIYFDSNDYKIPLKNDRVPELAFFFDIGYDHNESYLDEIRANLKGKEDLLNALKRLSQKGFEDNLTSNLTPSKWRLLCKRIPLTEIDDFSYERIKEMFEEIMVQLTDETDFKEELM